jgi:hypothetical protein
MDILEAVPFLTTPIAWQAPSEPLPAAGGDESRRKKAEHQARWKAEFARVEQMDRVERGTTARRKHRRGKAALGGLARAPGEWASFPSGEDTGSGSALCWIVEEGE